MDKKEWNKMKQIYMGLINKELKGFDGIVNRPSIDYNKHNRKKYLNISINFFDSCAGMVEWLTLSAVNRCPSGLVGSIPAPSAANKFLRVS